MKTKTKIKPPIQLLSKEEIALCISAVRIQCGELIKISQIGLTEELRTVATKNRFEYDKIWKKLNEMYDYYNK